MLDDARLYARALRFDSAHAIVWLNHGYLSSQSKRRNCEVHMHPIQCRDLENQKYDMTVVREIVGTSYNAINGPSCDRQLYAVHASDPPNNEV
jgi:hypothetical protein